VIISNNYDVANVSVTVFNDGIHDTACNFTIITKQIVTKYKADFKIMSPKDENDKNYERELAKSTIDIEKAMKGALGNYMFRSFFENFAKSADFELKLPFKKGILKLTNFTISDKSFPIPLASGKGYLEVRNYGKVQGKKSVVEFFTYRAYGEFRRD
jgi:hypothetical protein